MIRNDKLRGSYPTSYLMLLEEWHMGLRMLVCGEHMGGIEQTRNAYRNVWRWLSHRPDDGGSKNPRNVCQFVLDYTVQHPTRRSSSYLSPRELEISCTWFYLWNPLNDTDGDEETIVKSNTEESIAIIGGSSGTVQGRVCVSQAVLHHVKLKPILASTPACTWRDWGKPRKTSVRISSLRAEVWTRDMPNTKQDSNVKLNYSCDKASSCFTLFWIGNAWDICLPIGLW
jgi:hypothetical protein